MDMLNKEAFLALVRAGLWEQEAKLLPLGAIDFLQVLTLAEEQSAVGLVAAGIEQVKDIRVQTEHVLQFVGQALQLEQRNVAMNQFIGHIIETMREAGIYTVLIKGQGVAQCYVKPQWRTSGDVDLFLDENNYQKALAYLTPLATSVGEVDKDRLHVGMTIESWLVELHGTMHTEISKRIDVSIDAIQKDIFENNGVRIWKNGNTDIFLPSVDNDVFIIFTHFIDHFFVGGVGIRQICDWCRFLWTYRSEINADLLTCRLEEMGLFSEWKAFAAFAVDYLGMSEEAMPLYSTSPQYRRKARKILDLVFYTGNFGQNKDESYRSRYPHIVQIIITFCRRLAEFVRLTTIFPKDAPKFFLTYVTRRVKDSF